MADPGHFIRYESEIIGTDHCAVGSLLAGDWKLPARVKQGILRHHSNSDTLAPTDLAGLIQIAEYIVSRLQYTALPGMAVQLSPSLTSHVRENIEEYKTLAKDIPGELEKAKALYAPAGGMK
jgi:HD-like signal output (HDOD) protein